MHVQRSTATMNESDGAKRSRSQLSGLRVLGRGYEEKEGDDDDHRLTRVLSATKNQTELLSRRLSADSPFAQECSERLARELDVDGPLQKYREQRKAQGGSPIKKKPLTSRTADAAEGAAAAAAAMTRNGGGKAAPRDGDDKAPRKDGDDKAPPKDGDDKAPPIFGLTSLLSQSSRDGQLAEESYREQKLRDEIIRFQKRLKRRIKSRSRTMTMDLQGISNLSTVAGWGAGGSGSSSCAGQAALSDKTFPVSSGEALFPSVFLPLACPTHSNVLLRVQERETGYSRGVALVATRATRLLVISPPLRARREPRRS